MKKQAKWVEGVEYEFLTMGGNHFGEWCSFDVGVYYAGWFYGKKFTMKADSTFSRPANVILFADGTIDLESTFVFTSIKLNKNIDALAEKYFNF